MSAFVEYLCCGVESRGLVPTGMDTDDVNKASSEIVDFQQRKYYGQALRILESDSHEALTKDNDSVALAFRSR